MSATSEPIRDGAVVAAHAEASAPRDWRYATSLSLAALGIVYGDIGTSPLYALRESFLPEHGVAPSPANVLGVLSMITWALLLVISVKYLVFIVRADNRGEGGILALTSLITPTHALRRGRWSLIVLGLFGTALLYGDGMITPAISVLSAVEGLGIVTPAFEPFILPITIVILTLLFLVQRRGTGSVGRVFGPLTLLWFLTLAALGVWNLLQEPRVLAALSPVHAVHFFLANGWHAVLVLGSVFLVVTGGEALYADMGHFGRRPIRLAWFVVVLPALLLNYYGQGALVMRDPTAIANPFYRMAPTWALLPVVIVATMATVIASQALISGAFSLTLQAVQLGYSPRVRIEHTSARERGQIYVPAVNWLLMVSCIGLVLGFRSSTALAAAYGVAVTATMTITTVLFYFVARERWAWSRPAALAVTGGFLAIDAAFLGANLIKIPNGGWFPLVVGAVVFTLLATWKRGRQILSKRLRESAPEREGFLASLLAHPPVRVPGTAVQPQAQQGAARACRLSRGAHRGSPMGAAGGARRHRGSRSRHVAGGSPLRLHGGCGHSRRPRVDPARATGVQAPRDHVLPWSRDRHRVRTSRHGPVARAAVRAALAQCAASGCLRCSRAMHRRRPPIFGCPPTASWNSAHKSRSDGCGTAEAPGSGAAPGDWPRRRPPLYEPGRPGGRPCTNRGGRRQLWACCDCDRWAGSWPRCWW